MSHIVRKVCTIDEDYPADKWLAYFKLVKEDYLKWFLEDGESQRPRLKKCDEALKKYMPEFHKLWQELIKLGQADKQTARMLSLYCPSSYKRGCTQAVWSRYSPILVRNYDYDPKLFEARIVKSKWHETEVICTTDCLWGALDGINEHGLCLSLAYGGSSVVGEGFGVTLVLRYALEFCKTTKEVVELFKRIPVNMAYNITAVDAYTNVQTIQLTPYDEPRVSACPFAVNQQGGFDLNSFAIFSNSSEREQTIKELLFDPLVSIESFIGAFEYAPLFTSDYDNAFGTLYTSIYNPFLRAAEFRFPGDIRFYQSFAQFIEQEFFVTY